MQTTDLSERKLRVFFHNILLLSFYSKPLWGCKNTRPYKADSTLPLVKIINLALTLQLAKFVLE